MERRFAALIEGYRSAIEWDCVGPGTGPPTREILMECLQLLGTLYALAMILLSEIIKTFNDVYYIIIN
jgi:hypothetical protein